MYLKFLIIEWRELFMEFKSLVQIELSRDLGKKAVLFGQLVTGVKKLDSEESNTALITRKISGKTYDIVFSVFETSFGKLPFRLSSSSADKTVLDRLEFEVEGKLSPEQFHFFAIHTSVVLKQLFNNFVTADKMTVATFDEGFTPDLVLNPS